MVLFRERKVTMANVNILETVDATLTTPPELAAPVAGEPAESTGDTWSGRRARQETDQKRAMGRYFANHDFLVNTDTNSRTTVASILVNQGTTPNVVVEEALSWVKQQNWTPDITWYTPGSLVPGNLRSLRLKHPGLRSATRVFLFPGQVDPETEAVSGPEALRFAEQLKRRFTYALLSAYCFLMSQGEIFFHYVDEIPLQRACAKLYAAHKFLFFDSSKFRGEGDPGYAIADLLATSEAVTIYTVAPGNASQLVGDFETLCKNVLEIDDSGAPGNKTLRLCLVAKEDAPPTVKQHSGRLKVVGSSV
jgi:hypothetical protein